MPTTCTFFTFEIQEYRLRNVFFLFFVVSFPSNQQTREVATGAWPNRGKTYIGTDLIFFALGAFGLVTVNGINPGPTNAQQLHSHLPWPASCHLSWCRSCGRP